MAMSAFDTLGRNAGGGRLVAMPRDLNALSLDELLATLVPTAALRRSCASFLAEDIGSGDVTCRLTIPAKARGTARVVAREACVLAGLDAAAFLATSGKRDLLFVERARDGARVRAGAVVAIIEGGLRDLLEVERSVLNLLGRLSGVATQTAAFVARVKQVRGSRVKVFDTRKTTPGLRALEKYAVRAGGGHLHRLGLFDAVLVKDNHLAALAGLAPGAPGEAKEASSARALASLRAKLERMSTTRRRLRFVEVEVDHLDQLAEILCWPEGLVDFVLLDNMSVAQLRRAVAMRDRAKSAIELEASGGVRLASVAAIARSGVDRISIGSLTHAARSIDLTLEVESSTPSRRPSTSARASRGRSAKRR